MNSSRSSRFFDEQSLSLSGMPAPSSSVLRRMTSRAFLAAARAWAAAMPLRTILLASVGFSSSQSPSFSLVARWTSVFIAVLPSLALVWPSNCGSRSRTEMMAVMPSRMSSPARLGSFSLSWFLARAYLLTAVVSAALNPSSWVPPSTVLMPLAKLWMPSVL